MNSDIVVEILRELWRYKTTDKYTEIEIRRALETAIEAVNGLRPHGEMRLIDADALIATLRESKYMIYHANATLPIIQNNEIERCISFVETAPTIKAFTIADIEDQYRKGLEKGLEEAEPKKCPICGNDLYEYCFMCCYEGKKVTKNDNN
jgi:hypothetical protein